MQTIAIKIENPRRVAARIGECAGDYSPAECQWWVGTHKELYPAASAGSARVIRAKVQFCGGSAWIAQTSRRVQLAERYGWAKRSGETRLGGSRPVSTALWAWHQGSFWRRVPGVGDSHADAARRAYFRASHVLWPTAVAPLP